MNHYFISGSSRGIGKALAELLLAEAENHVYGISRSPSGLETKRNYTHFQADLSDTIQTASFVFPVLSGARRIVLINNAGIVGNIGPLGTQKAPDIEKVLTVNLISPAILLNAFIAAYQHSHTAERIVLNISSGAGRSPVDGWGAYCASKAGIDMLSRVAACEQPPNGIRVFSLAPGIVDTQMQEQIRGASVESFSRRDEFIAHKQENRLADPYSIAKKIVSILGNNRRITETVFSIKEYETWML